MKQIVLDTNVLVSGLISSKGAPGRILDALRIGVIQLALDDRIFSEYRDVLHRPHFADYFTEWERDRVLEYIYHESLFSVCPIHISNLPDPNDACFLELAHFIQVPLVTGNLKHFPKNQRRNVTVLLPAEFLDVYLQS